MPRSERKKSALRSSGAYPRAAILGAMLLAAGASACGGTGMNRGNPMSPTTGSGTFSSNGERIYFTATSASGSPISYAGGPGGGLMMMPMACVTCHHADGHGGPAIMFGQTFTAPDVSWPALTGPDPEMDHPPYTEATVRLAITNGVDPGGGALDSMMPRWSMSASDLDDLVGFLKSLK